MRLIRNLNDLKKSGIGDVGSCLAIGNYDGVHVGHRQILQRLISKAKEKGLFACVMIFEPQPEEYINPGLAPPRLMMLSEKILSLQELNIDFLVCLRFDKNIANFAACDFIERVIVGILGARYIVIGNDFHFGAQKKGDVKLLEAYGRKLEFDVDVLPDYKLSGLRVSATLIRAALQKGDLKTAEKFLGERYKIRGRVIHGSKLGRDLGFKTANISLFHRVSPLSGVYVVEIHGLDKPYYGVANIGMRPTVLGNFKSLEVYIFDFDRDIYGVKVNIIFLYKLRDEKKFAGLSALSLQIKNDIEMAKMVLKNMSFITR